MVSMDIAKSNPTVGLEFQAPTGAKGKIIAERSPRGKLQAALICITCGDTHVREVSDWHQCGKCPKCKPSKGRKSVSAQVGNLTQILPTDPPELVELKKQLQEAEAEERRIAEAEKAKEMLTAQLEQVKSRLAALKAKQAPQVQAVEAEAA